MQQYCDSIYIGAAFSFYVPNAFSPNGDGKNEFFKGYGEGIKSLHMTIWDRWGNLLFETSDQLVGWDGNGDMAGAYVYKIELYDIFDNKHEYVGHFSLIR